MPSQPGFRRRAAVQLTFIAPVMQWSIIGCWCISDIGAVNS